MDRDDLMTLVSDLDMVAVKADGTVLNADDDEYDPDDVAAALAALRADCERLARVVAWARLAPERTPATAAV